MLLNELKEMLALDPNGRVVLRDNDSSPSKREAITTAADLIRRINDGAINKVFKQLDDNFFLATTKNNKVITILVCISLTKLPKEDNLVEDQPIQKQLAQKELTMLKKLQAA